VNPTEHDKNIKDFYMFLHNTPNNKSNEKFMVRVGLFPNPNENYKDKYQYELTFSAIKFLLENKVCHYCVVTKNSKDIHSCFSIIDSVEGRIINTKNSMDYNIEDIISKLYLLNHPMSENREERILFELITLQAKRKFTIQHIKEAYENSTKKLLEKTINWYVATNKLCIEAKDKD
jgi:hypothetical protein